MKYVRSNTIVISVNNSIFIGEDYDFSEAEERELSEKLNEIEKDISKDDKIADDMEKMIQQHLNVSPTQLPQSLKYLSTISKKVYFFSRALLIPELGL